MKSRYPVRDVSFLSRQLSLPDTFLHLLAGEPWSSDPAHLQASKCVWPGHGSGCLVAEGCGRAMSQGAGGGGHPAAPHLCSQLWLKKELAGWRRYLQAFCHLLAE